MEGDDLYAEVGGKWTRDAGSRRQPELRQGSYNSYVVNAAGVELTRTGEINDKYRHKPHQNLQSRGTGEGRDASVHFAADRPRPPAPVLGQSGRPPGGGEFREGRDSLDMKQHHKYIKKHHQDSSSRHYEQNVETSRRHLDLESGRRHLKQQQTALPNGGLQIVTTRYRDSGGGGGSSSNRSRRGSGHDSIAHSDKCAGIGSLSSKHKPHQVTSRIDNMHRPGTMGDHSSRIISNGYAARSVLKGVGPHPQVDHHHVVSTSRTTPGDQHGSTTTRYTVSDRDPTGDHVNRTGERYPHDPYLTHLGEGESDHPKAPSSRVRTKGGVGTRGATGEHHQGKHRTGERVHFDPQVHPIRTTTTTRKGIDQDPTGAHHVIDKNTDNEYDPHLSHLDTKVSTAYLDQPPPVSSISNNTSAHHAATTTHLKGVLKTTKTPLSTGGPHQEGANHKTSRISEKLPDSGSHGNNPGTGPGSNSHPPVGVGGEAGQGSDGEGGGGIPARSIIDGGEVVPFTGGGDIGGGAGVQSGASINNSGLQQPHLGRLQVVKEADKAHPKRPGVKAIHWNFWQEGPWAEGFPDETLTMEDTDISPGFAIRKIALLFENQKYGECTAVVRRISNITLKTIVAELPIEQLIGAIPQSIPILEAIYTRFYNIDRENFPTVPLMPEKVVSQLIKWLATLDDPQSSAKNSKTYYTNYESIVPYSHSILKTIAHVHPQIRKKLKQRQKGLLDSVESLGDHGLVDTSESKLMNLHDALKIEFNKMVQQLKGAIMRLETVSFSHRLPLKTTLIRGAAPSGASHQRLMQMSHSEVQERLIKNKSLLNVVEPAISNSYLASLLQTLEDRIDADKMILFHFTELRKDMTELPQHAMISSCFQQYARAYSKVIDVIMEVTMETTSLDTNGYHSNNEDDAPEGLNSSQNSGECYLPPMTPLGQRRSAARLATARVTATSSGTNSAATSRESQPRPGIVSRQKASFSASSTTSTNGLMSRSKNTNLAASTTHLPSATSTLGEHHADRNRKGFSASTQNLALPRSQQNHIGGSTQSLALPNGTHSILEEDGGTDSKELDALKSEVALLRKDLKRCRETISKMQDREKHMKDRLSEHALKQLEAGSKFENLNLGDNRPTQLIRRYGNLYSQTRVEAFDALDDLPEMAEFDDLKGKLLFSVVVLAFRSVQHSVRQLRARVRHLLYLPDPRSRTSPEPIAREMEDTITVYLKKTVEKYDLSSNIKEVSQQVWATLFDYPSLKTCSGLKVYIEECVTLAWAVSVQVPQLTIDYECRMFDPDCHTRFHTSDPDSEQVKCVLWPALVEADSGSCVHKAVVLT